MDTGKLGLVITVMATDLIKLSVLQYGSIVKQRKHMHITEFNVQVNTYT